ncbi:hypothetical protein ACFCYB_15810, partial [Streptomyces sp. NPDC056309]
MTVIGSSWSVEWSRVSAGLARTRGSGQAGAAPAKRTGRAMADVDAGGGDRMAPAVLTQYRM